MVVRADLASQLRRGALEYCVLALLTSGPRYGFDLVRSLGATGEMVTGEGTLYPLLSRLHREGLVSTEWRDSESGPPRKYYSTTPQGVEALRSFRSEWDRFSKSVDAILGEARI